MSSVTLKLSKSEQNRAKQLFQEYIKTMPEKEALEEVVKKLKYTIEEEPTVVKPIDDWFGYKDAYQG